MPRNRSKQGEYKTFHPNGRIQAQIFYKNGAPDGKARYWAKNGQLLTEHSFRDGVLDGIFRFWGENGTRFSVERFYRNGLLVRHINRTKKNGLFQMKNHLKNRSDFFSQYLISDLTGIVSN